MKYIFFLGGIDAEMLEIEKILKSKSLTYFNKNLKWGAKLSDYKNELKSIKDDECAILVELNIDDKNLLPKNYKIIDHHNEYSLTPEGNLQKSSLEQIADLLGIKLTREQELIAANDIDIYRGLIRINATKDEIENIDKLEFSAQSITDTEIANAKYDLENNSEIYPDYDLIIIKTTLSKTRPFFKFLFDFNKGNFLYNHIVIIIDNSSIKNTIYSGPGEIVKRLIEYFFKEKETYPELNFFYGGFLPLTGYFGVNKTLTPTFIKKIITQKIYSSHIFLFPFVLENINCFSQGDIIFRKLINNIKSDSWALENFELSCKNYTYPLDDEIIQKYNRYNYFYGFVNETLIHKSDLDNAYALKFYLKNVENYNGKFIIQINTNYISKIFCLKIFSINVYFFKNNIGILEIGLHNRIYDDPDTILMINDFGRRIYPQFIGKFGTTETKKVFLADKIEIKLDRLLNIIEDFKSEKFIRQDYTQELYVNKILQSLIPNLFDNIRIKPILDDRMFTVCWYGSKMQSDEITKKSDFRTNLWWYKYIFVDGIEQGVANTEMMSKLIISSTYSRFLNYGTIYGITRYSFVCLSTDDVFARDIIRIHVEQLYKTMVLIVLAQRATIIYFYDTLNKLNLKGMDFETYEKTLYEYDKIIEKIEKFNEMFFNFLLKLNFDEVTAQEQGIELYDLLLKKTKIKKQLSKIRQLITDLHPIVNIAVENRRNKLRKRRQELFEKITLIGATFAPISLYLTFENLLKNTFIYSETLRSHFLIPESLFYNSWRFSLFIMIFTLFVTLLNEKFKPGLGLDTGNFDPLKSIYNAYTNFSGISQKQKFYKILLILSTSIFFTILFIVLVSKIFLRV